MITTKIKLYFNFSSALLIFLLLKGSSEVAQEIINEFTSNSFTTYPGWTMNPYSIYAFSDCGRYGRLFGGYGSFLNLELYKNYAWPSLAHFQLYFKLKVIKIDSWDWRKEWGWDSLDVLLDGKVVAALSVSDGYYGSSHECGVSNNDYWKERLFDLSFSIGQHYASSIELRFNTHFWGEADEWWGIRDIHISLDLCDKSCAACTNAISCTSCFTNAYLNSNLCTCRKYYYQQNVVSCSQDPCSSCERCHISCRTCNGAQSNNCLSCEPEDLYSASSKSCNYPANALVVTREFISPNFDETDLKNWAINPTFPSGQRTSTCGPYKIVGGFNKFGAGAFVQRSWNNLPPHYGVRIKMLFLKIDGWEDGSLIVNVDGENIIDTRINSDIYLPLSLCGNSDQETEITFSKTFVHKATNLNLKISTSLDEPSSNESWGFSNFELVVYKCDSSGTNSSSICLSCVYPFFLIGEQCVLKCPEPFFGNNITHKCVAACEKNEYADQYRVCKPCNATCSSCFEESSLSCFSCIYPYFLSGTSCVLVCQNPFWGDNSTRKCEASCTKTNEFGDISDNRICKPCNPQCKTCNFTANSCTSCSSPYYLNNNTCVSQCPTDNFEDVSDRVCKPCYGACNSCFAGTSNSCLSCVSPYFLSGISCVAVCPSPLWGNNGTRKCEAQCTNKNEFGDISDSRICKTCDQKCKTCDSAKSCRSCAIPYYFNNELCVEKCPYANQYADNTDQICKPCDPSCSSCFSGNSLSCLSCTSPYFLSGLSCVLVCPYPYWGNNVTRKCENSCKSSNEFGDVNGNRICKKCSENCKTCISTANTCTSCDNKYALVNNFCVERCPVGNTGIKYWDIKEQKCKMCDPACDTCFAGNSTSCLSCRYPYFLLGSSCVISCPSPLWGSDVTNKCEVSCTNSNEFGDVNENRICKKCNDICKTCASKANNCTSCETSLMLINNSCFEVCPEGANYFWDKIDQICKPCNPACGTCFAGDSISCLSCIPPNFLLGSTCVSECPSPLWGENKTRKCEKSCSISNAYGDILFNRTCMNCSTHCAACSVAADNCTKYISTFPPDTCIYSNELIVVSVVLTVIILTFFLKMMYSWVKNNRSKKRPKIHPGTKESTIELTTQEPK